MLWNQQRFHLKQTANIIAVSNAIYYDSMIFFPANIPLIVGLSVSLGVVAVTGISVGIAFVIYKTLIVK